MPNLQLSGRSSAQSWAGGAGLVPPSGSLPQESMPMILCPTDNLSPPPKPPFSRSWPWSGLVSTVPGTSSCIPQTKNLPSTEELPCSGYSGQSHLEPGPASGLPAPVPFLTTCLSSQVSLLPQVLSFNCPLWKGHKSTLISNHELFTTSKLQVNGLGVVAYTFNLITLEVEAGRF